MSMRERFKEGQSFDGVVEEIDTVEGDLHDVVDKRPIKRKPEYDIDTAIDYKKKKWNNLFNDIIKYPSPDGLYEKDFGNDVWDLRRLERYVDDTYTLLYLPSILAYKGIRIQSKKKGYIRYE